MERHLAHRVRPKDECRRPCSYLRDVLDLALGTVLPRRGEVLRPLAVPGGNLQVLRPLEFARREVSIFVFEYGDFEYDPD